MLELVGVPDVQHEEVSVMISILPATLPMLAQIYVQPAFEVMATEALRLLCHALSEHRVFQHQIILVHAPHPLIRKALQTDVSKSFPSIENNEGKAILVNFKSCNLVRLEMMPPEVTTSMLSDEAEEVEGKSAW